MLNRKRQIIDNLLEDLQDTYWDFIEEALVVSDYRESTEVIFYIRNLNDTSYN